jgi:DNA invertase Pin-like site-specific DNA recombinase
MIGVFAQLERDLVSERTREALNHKRAKGEWVGRTPTGFRINEEGRLEADPEALKMIARAKRLKREGASFGSISRALEMPKTTIYRLINDNLRNRKHNYLNTITN